MGRYAGLKQRAAMAGYENPASYVLATVKACGSISAGARALGVANNTVKYHLDKAGVKLVALVQVVELTNV
jgi:molybdenum-dependent DNA-binding transcriptional regulator ModE